ncbi:UxaA family hydrolase [Shinella sp. BYT-45]|uniref:UxaA family hydrolase n=1 Tax=Shinella sp. BYT-45 TaxID=3377377 RepID=UPI00398138DD
MAMKKTHATALRLDARDNVATALEDISRQAIVETGGEPITLAIRESIPMGHKLALRDIPAGAAIIKYGETIGRATTAIAAGAHVHVHNLASNRAR